jgi:hypothetical protein
MLFLLKYNALRLFAIAVAILQLRLVLLHKYYYQEGLTELN